MINLNRLMINVDTLEVCEYKNNKDISDKQNKGYRVIDNGNPDEMFKDLFSIIFALQKRIRYAEVEIHNLRQCADSDYFDIRNEIRKIDEF